MEIWKSHKWNAGFDARGRRATRFSVPGATIELKASSAGRADRNPNAERLPVVDLSRGGLSFLANSPPRQSRISLALAYSDEEEPIPLEGRIVYSVPRGAPLSYHYRVGVEFAPFSHHRGHNSLEALSLLEKLEGRFGAQESDDIPETGES